MRKTGDAYFDSDEFRQLLTEYEEAKSNGQPVFLDADELAEIADYYQMTEHLDEADEAISLALSLSPGAIAPLTYKIHEALWYGKTDEARQYLEQIIETDEPDYVYDKAEIMLAEGRIDDADTFLLDELAQVTADERQDFIVDVANIFQDYGYSQKSMEWMARAHNEDSEDFKELMARTLFGLGKYKDSERIWDELIDTNPFSKHYWTALASTQFMNENYSGAVESSEYALAIDPDDPDGLLSKANGLYRLSNYEEALKYYERYAEHVPDDDFCLTNQGTCLINLGRRQEAIVLLQKALDIALSDPSDLPPYIGDIYQELAFAYSEEGDTQHAMALLDKADEYEGDHSQTLVVKGHIMLSSGDVEAAERYFREAIFSSETPIQTLLRVIVSLYDNRLVEAAYKMFLKFFKVFGDDNNDGYAYMALCCYDLKHYDEFLHYLQIACERNPRECLVALSHIFPDDVEPQNYYTYIKDRMR